MPKINITEEALNILQQKAKGKFSKIKKLPNNLRVISIDEEVMEWLDKNTLIGESYSSVIIRMCSTLQ